MLSSNLEFLATTHQLCATQRELADMLDALTNFAEGCRIDQIPVSPVLLAKISSMLRINAQLTAQLLSENEQINDGLEKISARLNNQK